MNLALLTDLYQLTMAQGYFLSGRADDQAVFHLFFRKPPFGSGYTVACGLAEVVGYLDGLAFGSDEVDYLATLRGDDEQPLFVERFLERLRGLTLHVDVDAMPEGTVVFGQEPLVRVRGPILEAQLLETTLLTLVNFQSLIATKAARVALAAGGDPVIEFGLRRAHGVDGGLSASRAAYIGGCSATSNVLAGKRFGIPVRGTHAHSWVMSFESEPEAFAAWAEAMPNNTVFLVDTYDTLTGVRHAIEAGRALRARGFRMAGIRLDSGDLAWLSIEARKMLDAAGFADTTIVASNDLDEHIIESLKHQGAAVGVWGVGTRLVTGYDQPSLGGVYKLSAVRPASGGPWRHRVKLSEQVAKVSTPGVQQVRRFRDPDSGLFVADVIYDEELGVSAPPALVDPLDPLRRRTLPDSLPWEDLLVPVLRAGRLTYHPPPASEARARTLTQLGGLSPSSRRLRNPHEYPVGLEVRLAELRARLVLEARARKG
jgi:nicotinate phosphoribosyltransferase